VSCDAVASVGGLRSTSCNISRNRLEQGGIEIMEPSEAGRLRSPRELDASGTTGTVEGDRTSGTGTTTVLVVAGKIRGSGWLESGTRSGSEALEAGIGNRGSEAMGFGALENSGT